MKARLAWGSVVVLAGVVLGATLAAMQMLAPYWKAKYHGERACLSGAFLPYAPLADGYLPGADLRHANL
jgi:hypothetical protein